MEKIKKILKIAGDVITLLLVVLAVFMIIFTVISTAVLDESERNFLGYRGFVVLSDSMSATDFDAGDIVFIRRQDDVDDGEIAAVILDEAITLKRIFHIKNGLQLLSMNDKYPPMVFTFDTCETIRILGKAVGFQSSL